MSKRLLRLMAMVFALALFAAACGSDDVTDIAEEAGEVVDDAVDAVDEAAEEVMGEDDDEGDEGDLGAVDEEAATEAIAEAAEEEAPADTSSDQAATIADLEAEWAARRAEIVDDIIANGYGIDGDKLIGPAGFEIDLSACPSDWSDTEGIVDGKVLIGHTTAQSGTLAIYGNIGVGMTTYFDYVNENGGIGPDGLQLELSIKDDAYDPSLTQEYVDEFLDASKPFYITTLGTPNTFSVQEQLNEQCVPQPFSMTGHPAWGDPLNFPWTTGLQLNYFTEGVLWGGWIEQNLADQAPIKVAALVADNDFGLAYEKGFAEFVANSDSGIIDPDVEFVRHDVAAATLTNEITTLQPATPTSSSR